MVLQLMLSKNEALFRILPGVALLYGEYGVVHKSVALLWALYLVCGLNYALIEWLLSKICSLTTDQGCEFGIGSMPNFFPYFYSWLNRTSGTGDRCSIDWTSTLLPNSIRVAGWGHLHGGLMKTACNFAQHWPQIVKGMRILSAFFRVTSWRRRVADYAQGRLPDVKTLMERSYPSLAKWRYCISKGLARRGIHLKKRGWEGGREGRGIEVRASGRSNGRTVGRTDGGSEGWTDAGAGGRAVSRMDRRTGEMSDGRMVGRTKGRTLEERMDERPGPFMIIFIIFMFESSIKLSCLHHLLMALIP